LTIFLFFNKNRLLAGGNVISFALQILMKDCKSAGNSSSESPQHFSNMLGCGSIVRRTLKKRQHDCPVCGMSVDRDVNASYNILRLGTDRVIEGFA
jgi:hypothetical protein